MKPIISILVFCLLCTSNQLMLASDSPPPLLNKHTVPNLVTLLPPPPSTQDAAFKQDQSAYKHLHSDSDRSRQQLALEDSVLDYQHVDNVMPLAQQFSAAFGQTISPKTTPYTYKILQQIVLNHELFTGATKQHYQRQRPFVFYHQHTCNPNDEAYLIHDGSYPSGHSTIGWATGLALAEVSPSRSSQLIQRGYEYGQSRVVCGAHWQSDVDAGRLVGSILMASLNATPLFQHWLTLAQQEVINPGKT